MRSRWHATNTSRGAISVSLAIVLGLVAVGLVVALLGVVLGFASGGEDTSAAEKRVAQIQKQVKTANSEFADSLNALQSKTATTADIVKVADEMVANSNQSVAVVEQQLNAGRADDADTYNAVNDQWLLLRAAHTDLERQLGVLIGAS